MNNITRAKNAIRRLGDEIRSLKPEQKAERLSLVKQIQALKTKDLKDVYAAKRAASRKSYNDAVSGARCQHHISTKKRYCKQQPIAGTSFCHMHTEFSEHNGQKRKRVPCPLNSKHSVYEHDIEQHILVCPDRPRPVDTTRPFYSQSANRGDVIFDNASSATSSSLSSSSSSSSSLSSSPLPTSSTATTLDLNLRDAAAVRAFNTRVEKLLVETAQFSGNSVEPRSSEITPASCSKHLENATRIVLTTSINMGLPLPSSSVDNSKQHVPKMLKHARQIASIVGNIEKAQLSSAPEETAFVELGAGKGTLSCMLSETAGRGGSFVLVDRGTGFRNKSDKKIREASGSFERHTMDIADLKLGALPGVASKSECVLVSKHLCGVATCFALRSAVAMKCESCTLPSSSSSSSSSTTTTTTSSSASSYSSSSKTTQVKGFALATCCHHLCNWNDYVNREFFIEGGFTEKDFQALLRMTSWATSGFGKARAAEHKQEENHLKDEEKREFGKRCKTALDVGRLLYLKRNGFECEIVQYIDRAITPENRLLVGKRM